MDAAAAAFDALLEFAEDGPDRRPLEIAAHRARLPRHGNARQRPLERLHGLVADLLVVGRGWIHDALEEDPLADQLLKEQRLPLERTRFGLPGPGDEQQARVAKHDDLFSESCG